MVGTAGATSEWGGDPMSETVDGTPPLDTEPAVEAFVRAQADNVHDPCSMAIGLNVGLAEMGLIRHVAASHVGERWAVEVTVRLTSPGCQYFFSFQEQLQAHLLAHPQIARADVTWDHTLDWTPEDMADTAKHRIAERMRRLPTERNAVRQLRKASSTNQRALAP